MFKEKHDLTLQRRNWVGKITLQGVNLKREVRVLVTSRKLQFSKRERSGRGRETIRSSKTAL